MRVLIVEDSLPLRESVAQGLREAGYAVDASGDGGEGLWYAQSGDYDVIILDIMLPRVDGWTVLERLRAAKVRSSVLILTAKDTSEDVVRGLDGGADDYLTKPFALNELLARVRALIRRLYDAKSSIIQIADLEINLVQRRVVRSGQQVVLSGREYALLEFLALNPNKIVSREEIWQHIYDSNGSVDSNVVDVFIGHLRRKIEREGLVRLIHTRRGQGYTLGADVE